MKKIILILCLLFFNYTNVFADNVYFLDFNKVLNSSKAGVAAQAELQKKFISESSKFKKKEAEVIKEEADLIAKKNLISKEEYKKTVQALRAKVLELQKKKKKSLNSIQKARNTARSNLLKTINPIIKKYMEDNKIRVIVAKQSVVLGDKTLEITDQIIAILNKN